MISADIKYVSKWCLKIYIGIIAADRNVKGLCIFNQSMHGSVDLAPILM